MRSRNSNLKHKTKKPVLDRLLCFMFYRILHQTAA
jgi:hypothetical protein